MLLNIIAGYVQGMSDLLSPILVLMENEVDAFWCLAGFMEMVVSLNKLLILLFSSLCCRLNSRATTLKWIKLG